MHQGEFTPASGEWFPEVGFSQVLAQFGSVAALDIPKSKEADEPVYRQVPAVQVKVIGSSDISTHALKPANTSSFIARFPEAWAAYEGKASDVDGTPLDALEIDHTRSVKLKAAGVRSLEQLAEMSDATCANLGFGFRKLRTEAQDFLKNEAPKVVELPKKRGRPRKVVDNDASNDLPNGN